MKRGNTNTSSNSRSCIENLGLVREQVRLAKFEKRLRKLTLGGLFNIHPLKIITEVFSPLHLLAHFERLLRGLMAEKIWLKGTSSSDMYWSSTNTKEASDSMQFTCAFSLFADNCDIYCLLCRPQTELYSKHPSGFPNIVCMTILTIMNQSLPCLCPGTNAHMQQAVDSVSSFSGFSVQSTNVIATQPPASNILNKGAVGLAWKTMF